MAEFHFVEDYERIVKNLTDAYPLEEAMSLAVGGNWNAIQSIEVSAVRHFGLRDGMSLLDLGCGSGRLAQGLAQSGITIDYFGLDIVQALLDYAQSITPKRYKFKLNRALNLPVDDSSIDVFCACSVFTHLLPEETYLYLEDAYRALRSGGFVLFSFLEFTGPGHWQIFESTVEALRAKTQTHLNTFLSREAIRKIAESLGYKQIRFLDGDDAPWEKGPLGQSIAVLSKT